MNIDESSTKLSKNPLGIIALFILLIYGFATLLFGFIGDVFSENQKWCFVIFLVSFPVIVLFLFSYLVIRHHQKLYAPYEYKEESHFFGYISPKEKELQYEQEEITDDKDSKLDIEQQQVKRAEEREKIRLLENNVIDYYKKKFNSNIDRDIFYKINETRILFDGLIDDKNTLTFLKIKYIRHNFISKFFLDMHILNTIKVREFLIKNEQYINYRFKLLLVFVVDIEDIVEIDKLDKNIRNMIDTEVINVESKIFTVKELQRKEL